MRLLLSARLFKSIVRSWGLSAHDKTVRYDQTDEEWYYPLILPYFMVLDRELERKADMELNVEKMTDGRNAIEKLLQIRLIAVRLCEFKSYPLSIDSRVLYAFMKKIYPQLDVRNKEVTGEDRTPTGRISSISCAPNRPKKGIHGDNLLRCGIHILTLSADAGTSRYPVCVIELAETRKKEGGPLDVYPYGNDFVVSLNPWNTNIITIAVPKRAADCIDGDLHQ
jgi:hypothetical protein